MRPRRLLSLFWFLYMGGLGVSQSASMAWTSWNDPIGLPNCLRSLA